MSPLSMRNMVSMMADKIPVDEGVSWDDAVEAMKLRANEVNFNLSDQVRYGNKSKLKLNNPLQKLKCFVFVMQEWRVNFG